VISRTGVHRARCRRSASVARLAPPQGALERIRVCLDGGERVTVTRSRPADDAGPRRGIRLALRWPPEEVCLLPPKPDAPSGAARGGASAVARRRCVHPDARYGWRVMGACELGLGGGPLALAACATTSAPPKPREVAPAERESLSSALEPLLTGAGLGPRRWPSYVQARRTRRRRGFVACPR
jgi:hypothetical protein